MRKPSVLSEEQSLATGQETQTSLPLAQQMLPLLVAMRPREWTKNLLLFAGLIFSGHLLIVSSLLRAVLATISFCLVSGAIYLVNDLTDIQRDRLHPKKRLRPLAAGTLTPAVAIAGAGIATISALALAWVIALQPLQGKPVAVFLSGWPPQFGVSTSSHAVVGGADPYASLGGSGLLFAATIIVYFILQLGYSFRLKHVVLLDVFAIAAGFVIRAMAGAVAIAVPISAWLYLCTVLLALFLALNKRRQEVVTLVGGGVAHRPLLQEYTLPLLDQLITIVTAATIMAYSLYTFQSETVGDRRLMLTIPLVIYGIFRYLYLVHVRTLGGNPAEVLLRDRHIQATVIAWIAIVAFVLYVVPR